MDKTQADEIVIEIKRKNIRGSKPLEQYLNFKGVSSRDIPLVLSSMVEIDYDSYSYFVFMNIRENLASISTSPHFINLLKSFGKVEEEKNSNLLGFLLDLPSANRDSALEVFESIKESEIDSLKIASGLLLGQLHINFAEVVFEAIKNNLNSDNARKTSLVIAFELVVSKNKTLEPPNYVLNFIAKCCDSADRKLSYCATRASFVNLELDKVSFKNAITNYVEKSDDNKIGACDILQFRETNDGIFELHLLKLCAKSNSIKVINWITNVIGDKLYQSKIDKKLLTKEALELLRLWSQNENFQSLNKNHNHQSQSSTKLQLWRFGLHVDIQKSDQFLPLLPELETIARAVAFEAISAGSGVRSHQLILGFYQI